MGRVASTCRAVPVSAEACPPVDDNERRLPFTLASLRFQRLVYDAKLPVSFAEGTLAIDPEPPHVAPIKERGSGHWIGPAADSGAIQDWSMALPYRCSDTAQGQFAVPPGQRITCSRT